MTRFQSISRVFILVAVSACTGLFGAATVSVTPEAKADPEPGTTDQPDKVWAYEWNTFMGGFNFASNGAALSYGYGICEKVSQGRPYGQLIMDVRNDLDNPDGAAYLITQAVNELCPALIPQLRNSAVHFRG